MVKIFSVFIFIFVLFSNILSQVPQPTAAPEAEDDIVKISTNLIQVDVSVTDNNGNYVNDLKASDFEIYENGKKQEITNFSFITSKNTEPEPPAANKENLNLPPLPTKIKPDQVRRTIALVIDDLTLSFESTHFVRRALRKFVDEQMQPGDLVAIIRTGGGIGALQQFTGDKRQLYAAIEKIRWNLLGTGGVSAFAPIEATPLEIAKSQGADISEEQLEEEKRRIQEANEFRENYFAVGTLGAINYTIRGMQELPGRKSLILFSEGFSLTSTINGFKETSRVFRALQGLVDLANRASVVVYTIDARGLQTLGLTAADNTNALSGQQIGERLTQRSGELFDTQDGLNYLAKQTGGFAFLNNNDLSGGVKKILSDQSYYLIGYQPDEETFDPEKRRFNDLDVKVKRDNVRVRYRSGFFGVSDEERKKPVYKTAGDQLVNAITSPFAVNNIRLNLNTIFIGDKDNKQFIYGYLHINAADLTFTDEPNGNKKISFDILTISFGDNGAAVDEISKTFEISVRKERLKNFIEEGFVYYFIFPIKKPGAYQMRVAIRDHKSEKIGSANQFVEVPKLKKDRLTLSGLFLENTSFELWQQRNQAEKSGQNTSAANREEPNPLIDIALRQFRGGTVLNYGFEIYDAKTRNGQKPRLEMQTRLFYNGKVIFQGKERPIDVSGLNNFEIIKTGGAINLASDLEAGDYVLQIIVTDKLAKKNHQTATQFVQFEIVK